MDTLSPGRVKRPNNVQETMMAKSASKGSGAGSRKAADKTSKESESGRKSPKSAPRKTVTVRVSSRERSSESGNDEGNRAADMFLKLLQSPIVADLLAVAATAALAALAEHGFNRSGSGDQKRAGKAVKAAGKAAAAAIGRRLATEVEEIRKAAKSSGAEA